MATEIEVFGYTLFFIFCLFWTVFALDRKSIIGCFLSFVSWMAMSELQLAFFYDSVLFGVIGIYYGLGFVMLIVGFALILLKISETHKKKEWDIT